MAVTQIPFWRSVGYTPRAYDAAWDEMGDGTLGIDEVASAAFRAVHVEEPRWRSLQDGTWVTPW